MNRWVEISNRLHQRKTRLAVRATQGLPGGSMGKESACGAADAGDPGSIPRSGRSPRGGHGKPLQRSCLENPHGQRSLAGYSPWGHKEWDRTEVTEHAHKQSHPRREGWLQRCVSQEGFEGLHTAIVMPWEKLDHRTAGGVGHPIRQALHLWIQRPSRQGSGPAGERAWRTGETRPCWNWRQVTPQALWTRSLVSAGRFLHVA